MVPTNRSTASSAMNISACNGSETESKPGWASGHGGVTQRGAAPFESRVSDADGIQGERRGQPHRGIERPTHAHGAPDGRRSPVITGPKNPGRSPVRVSAQSPLSHAYAAPTVDSNAAPNRSNRALISAST